MPNENLDDLDAPEESTSEDDMSKLLSEPDEDEDEELEIGKEPEEPPLTRKEKRRRRGEEWRSNIREELDSAKQEIARLQGIAQMYPRPELLQQQLLASQPQGPKEEPDPFADELKTLEDAGTAIRDAYFEKQRTGTLTPEEAKDYQARAKRIEDRTKVLEFQRYQRQFGAPQQAQQQDPQQAAQAALGILLRSENPDIYGSEVAINLAKSVWSEEVERMGGKENVVGSKVLHDRVMAITRERLGWPDPHGRAPPATAGDRRRMSGAPRGSGAEYGPKPKTVKVGKMEREMADIALAHIKDPKERYQTWANTAGKARLEDER